MASFDDRCFQCGNNCINGYCNLCESFINSNPNSFNDSPKFSNYPPQPHMTSFNQHDYYGSGNTLDGSSNGFNQRYTCERCGNELINGFCSNCASRVENSFAYDPNPNSSNDFSKFSNYSSQPNLPSFDLQYCDGNQNQFQNPTVNL